MYDQPVSNPAFRELCYVLKTMPFKERDLIAVLFSESKGKFSAIARNGVQSRRFGGSLNLFTASDFEIDPKTVRIQEASDEGLVQVLQAQSRHVSENLGKSFEKLSAGSALNELILKIVPSNRPAPEIFKLYSNGLVALNDRPDDQAVAIVNAFILKITQWLGVQPSLTRCLHCQKALNEVRGESIFPEVTKGAWLCEECIPDRGKLQKLGKLVMLDAFHSMLHPIRKIEFQASRAEHELLLGILEKHLQYFVPGLDRAPLSAIHFLKSQPLPF